jgi:hypothetical protein
MDWVARHIVDTVERKHMHTQFCPEKHKRRDYDVDGRIILKWFLKKLGCGGVDWIHVTRNAWFSDWFS